MKRPVCYDEIKKAVGEDLSDEEISALADEMTARVKERRLSGKAEGYEQSVLAAAEEMAFDAKVAAAQAKRQEAINFRKRLEIGNYVSTQFAGKEAEGLEAVLVGVNSHKIGSRMSAGAAQRELSGYYLGMFTTELKAAGLLDEFAMGAHDKDIARALWAIDTEGAEIPKGRGAEIAKVIRKWQEIARTDANKAGAAIGKLPGYIVRQTHDQSAILLAGEDKWKEFILPRLDAAKTFRGKNVDKVLGAIYKNLASGTHLKASPGDSGGFKGPGNIAKKMSEERILHFKDADSWYEYNQEFGKGGLREAVTFGLEKMGRSTGLMRALGTNPENNIARVMESLERKLDSANTVALNKKKTMLQNRVDEIVGNTLIIGDKQLAEVGSVVRATQSMAKLGGAVLSAFTDIPLAASELRYQGRGMLSGIGEAISGMLSRNTDNKREISAMLGVFSDSMVGKINAHFDVNDTLPGTMAKLQRTFFKLNGLTWWTDKLKQSMALSMSHHLAINANKGFSSLGDDLGRTLSLFGIDEGKWDIIRAGKRMADDGREYMTPEGIRELPDSVFENYLASRGGSSSGKVKRLREEIESQLRQYYVDRAEYAVITPDARTRSILNQGTRRGTVIGELARFVMQFKAFPATVVQKAVGRELYGRGAAGFREFGASEYAGMANLIFYTTVFGYISMAAKDLVKGKIPRDPTDYKTIVAAMAQGGGAGIYGDFLFGEMRNRMGGGLSGTLLGPTLGTADDLMDLWGRLRNGDDTAAAAFKLLMNNTPFINLFYTRILLDHLFTFKIQEELNPGYLRRLEQRDRKEKGQEYFVKPSSAVY